MQSQPSPISPGQPISWRSISVGVCHCYSPLHWQELLAPTSARASLERPSVDANCRCAISRLETCLGHLMEETHICAFRDSSRKSCFISVLKDVHFPNTTGGIAVGQMIGPVSVRVRVILSVSVALTECQSCPQRTALRSAKWKWNDSLRSFVFTVRIHTVSHRANLYRC